MAGGFFSDWQPDIKWAVSYSPNNLQIKDYTRQTEKGAHRSLFIISYECAIKRLTRA